MPYENKGVDGLLLPLGRIFGNWLSTTDLRYRKAVKKFLWSDNQIRVPLLECLFRSDVNRRLWALTIFDESIFIYVFLARLCENVPTKEEQGSYVRRNWISARVRR